MQAILLGEGGCGLGHHRAMNPIKHILAGLCSSLLLSLGRETTAGHFIGGEWSASSQTPFDSRRVAPTVLPSQYAEP